MAWIINIVAEKKHSLIFIKTGFIQEFKILSYQSYYSLKQALNCNYHYLLFPFLYWLANFSFAVDKLFAFGMEDNYSLAARNDDGMKIVDCCFYFFAVVVGDKVVNVMRSLIQHDVDAAHLGRWLSLRSVTNETFQTCAQLRTWYVKADDPLKSWWRTLKKQKSPRSISPKSTRNCKHE